MAAPVYECKIIHLLFQFNSGQSTSARSRQDDYADYIEFVCVVLEQAIEKGEIKAVGKLVAQLAREGRSKINLATL